MRNFEEENWTVTLKLDGGETMECQALVTFTAAVNGVTYIALLPLEGPDSNGEDVYLYRYVESEDGEPGVQYIDSDEEYEIAADAYDELLDDQEYEQLWAKEDEEG